jgi:hypothetical protein
VIWMMTGPYTTSNANPDKPPRTTGQQKKKYAHDRISRDDILHLVVLISLRRGAVSLLAFVLPSAHAFGGKLGSRYGAPRGGES